MIRTQGRKLLYFQEEEKSQYYDLEKDPFELNNLYRDSAYREEINSLINRLSRWMLFDTLIPSYPPSAVKEITASNVPSRTDGHRETMENYIHDMMANYKHENT